MTDLDVYQPPAGPGQYQAGIVMTPESAKALDDQLTQCIRAILHEGTDYGIIPGTGGDKSLWRPGAQKLLLWFGLGFTCDQIGDIERDDDGRKLGVTYRAVITKRLPDGTLDVKATCEGYAGYDEDKFYQPAEQVQAKAEDRERMWAKKDGRVANPNKWKNLGEYRAPWNSVIKRAQKRAIVGGTLDATAAGGRFNQDREEDDHTPVADDGPSWYEQAIERAVDVTDPDEGNKLFVEAAEAHKKGWCNRKQQDLIQNILKKRARLLKKAAAVVDVEDLAAKAEAGHAQAAAEDSQDAGPGRADDEGREPPQDTLPVEDPPDWPEVVKPGTGTPKGK